MLFMTRLAGLALAAIVLHSHAAAAQAVDCRDAYSPDELTVCERPALKALDTELGQLYERALRQAHDDLHYLIREEQAAFERARNRCRTQQRCIARLTAARIRELSGLLGEDAQAPPPVQAGCSLFRDPNFAGERIFINPNEQMSFWGTNWDNAVSSVRIGGNCRAVLYTRALFNGTDARFSSDAANLGEANDRASSAQCVCQ